MKMKKIISLIGISLLMGCNPDVGFEETGSSTSESTSFSTSGSIDTFGMSETSIDPQVTTSGEVITTSGEDPNTSIVMTIVAIQECGDGLVEFPEECDDGNLIDDDECSNECVLPRFAFLSMSSVSSDFGGIEIADTLCQQDAKRSGLEGNFKAWLSDNNNASPKFRFNSEDFDGWYKLTNGANLAKGWIGLTSNDLLNWIDVFSNGQQNLITPEFAWTSTKQDGTAIKGGNCNNWKSLNDSEISIIGTIGANDSVWTVFTKAKCGSQINRFYCFQI